MKNNSTIDDDCKKSTYVTVKSVSRHIPLLIIFFLTALKPISLTGARNTQNDIVVRIDQPYSEHFPEMKVYVSITNKEKEPILSLVRGNFSVFVDGQKLTSRLDVAGYQYTEEGTAYALLIAGNGLMAGAPMEALKQAAANLSEYLRDQDLLSVYVFADEVKTFIEFQKKDESLMQTINKIDVLGSNPHLYDVLVFAARRLDNSRLTRKVIIVMSDGRDVGSRYTSEQLYKVLDEKNIPVYSIGVSLMAGQNLYKLAEISKHSGGEYIYAGSLANIPESMRLMHNQINLGYVLKFDVNTIEADNKLHQLQVKVQNKGSEDSFFKNFVAVKIPMSFWIIIILGVVVVVVIIIIIILIIIRLKKLRKEMGITKRICPVCKNKLKDNWNECLFCKHLEKKKKNFLHRLLKKE